MEQIARHWRKGYVACWGVWLAAVIGLGGFSAADIRPTWEFWTSGRVPQAAPVSPNRLQHAWYLTACGGLALWSVIGIVAGRPRNGVVGVLAAGVLATAYLTPDGRIPFAPLGALGISVISLMLGVSEEGRGRPPESVQASKM